MKELIFNGKSKKGLFALETLVATILSVIALISLFQIFSSVFLQTPTNLKIAQDNAKSIAEFIEYSNKRYINQDCYTLLKLRNIENYQFLDSENYFHIITNKGIKIFDKKNLDKIYEDKNYINNNRYFRNIEVNIQYDNTDKGLPISLELFGFNLGESDKNLNLLDGDFLLLQPVFKKNLAGFEIDIFEDNQNILYGKTFFENDFEDNLGNFLIYNPKTSNLFLSSSDYSNALIFKNSCFMVKTNEVI